MIHSGRASPGKVDRTRMAIIATLSLLALASVLLTALVAWPFSPYRVYGVRVIPPVVCPGQPVMVEGDSEVASGWLLKRIEVASVWEPVPPNATSPQSGGTGIIPEPDSRPRSITLSEVVRDAPTEPGAYRLKTESRVYGAFGGGVFRGFPKVQRLDYESTDLTRVLTEDDARCERDGIPEGIMDNDTEASVSEPGGAGREAT